MKRYSIGMVAACPFPAAFASSGLIREMADALHTNGHDVHVITYHLGNPSFPVGGYSVHRIPNVPGYNKVCSGITPTKPLLDFLLLRTLYKMALKYSFDVIHTHNYEAPPAGYFVRRKLDIPVVYHAHNTMVHELPSYFKSVFMQSVSRKVGFILDKTIPHKADHVITVSDEQTRYLSTLGVPLNQMTMIPPGIDTTLFAGGDGAAIRHKLNIGNAPLLVYTGGLQQYQNCRALIDLLLHCLTEIPDVHLLILARSEPKFIQQTAFSANIPDRVHFLQGQGLSFEKDCLAASNVGIIPRLHCIGFPIKLLNYAAADVPVVCFESVSKGFINSREILTAPDGDIPKMAQCVIQLIRNPHLAKTLALNAKKKLQEYHGWHEATKRIESIYDQVVTSRAI